MADVGALVPALQRIPLFSGLTQDQLETLARSAFRYHYGRGHVIFNRGDSADRAFVVLDGAVDLVIDSPNGRELILNRLGAGEHFGEMALVDDQLRSATARTAAPTDVVVVLRGSFLDALEHQPEMSRRIIHSLVQRLRQADDKIEAFAYLDAAGRIARALLGLDRSPGQSIQASHEEISNMSATSRQTATTLLNEWEDDGYVELSRRGVRVKDREALEALAQL